jgi:diguanylate cyclase (GGDEF)-like protein
MSKLHTRSENVAITDPALKHEIEDVLASGFRLLRFPYYLEQYFTQSYRRLALKNMLSNNLYLFGLYILMGLVVFIQFGDLERGIFNYTYAITGVGLVFLNICARLPFMDRWFHWYTGTVSMIILTAIMLTTSTVSHPTSVAGMQAISIYAVIIVYAMSKMRFYNTVIWCHLAGFATLVLSRYFNLHHSLFQFQAFFVFANVIGMGITYIIEHRERAMFLQGLLLDIDKAEKDILNQHLERLSREDSLTGLANRRYFDERLKMEWDRCLREKKPLSVILLDIDYFKQYNDHYGHLSGDHCLTMISRALKKEASRPAELVGRYGGEEFILLYPNIDATQIKNTLVRIQQRIVDLGIPHEGSKVKKVVTASLGAATVYPVKSLDPEKLVSAADQMLYKSKENGRNGWFNTQISHCEPEQQTLINLV